MKTKALLFTFSLLFLLLSSCKAYQVDANAKKLSIGMTKAEVTEILGTYYETIHGSVSTEGNVIEAWDYPTTTKGFAAVYKLYFVDGKLLRWDKEWLESLSPEVIVESFGQGE